MWETVFTVTFAMGTLAAWKVYLISGLTLAVVGLAGRMLRR